MADEFAENPVPEHETSEAVLDAAERAGGAIGGLAQARLDLRSVGYCVYCDALVERRADGTCDQRHPPEAIAGRILLLDDEPIPQLPRFNWAAFFLPPIWGPAHGQWAGAFFLPIWLFADSAIFSAVRQGGWFWVAAVVVFSGTLGFEYFFARRANGVAFRRVMASMTLAEYERRQRTWTWFAVPAGVALIGWGIYFDIVLAPVLKR